MRSSVPSSHGAAHRVVGQALASARSALAARDRELADADRELSEVIAGAYATATAAIRRLEEINSDIDAVAADPIGTAPQGREFARDLLSRQRELLDIVSAAKADVATKVTALQQLRLRFR